MHSAEDNKRYDERERMTDDVDKLRKTIQELEDEIAQLKAERGTGDFSSTGK